jgi:hypothetical protein
MKATHNAKTTPPKNRAFHRPITIHVENVEDLPEIKVIPRETLITVNLKMKKDIAKKLVAHIQRQLDSPVDVDFVASTITGVSP